MKKLFTITLLVLSLAVQAQTGIGTTSPNSTLDLRGSLSLNYTSFTVSTTAGASDNTLVFTGTTAATLTLPTAVGITGRVYNIKNASSNASVLTLATTSSQTIDGVTTKLLNNSYQTMAVVSNGTNWLIYGFGLPSGGGTYWSQGGNAVAGIANLGTISAYDLPFITNNTEKMRITSTGSVGIGTSSFNVTNPEKLVVDAGTTSSVNAIVGKGTINNYLQLNIQNLSAGTSASSDVVATADNGTETTNYVDMGINSSANTSGAMGGADDAYLYNIGQNFLIGTGTAAKSLVFMTGGTAQSTNERMRIDGSGNIGIGINSPAYKLHVVAASNPLFLAGVQTGANTDSVLTIINGVVRKLHPSALVTSAWSLIGNSGISPATNFIGTTDNKSLRFRTNNIQRLIIDSIGNIGIGTSTFNVTYPEKLIVDAGSTGNTNYQNVIVGKGNTNSYTQLNIQNFSTGTAASSDVVATADNGTEAINYIDMGINGSGNTSSGILGASNNAYLFATGNDFTIGNSTENKDLIFFTTVPTATSTERMRVTGTGVKLSGSLTVPYRSGTGNYTLLTTDYVIINTGAAATWTLPTASTCPGKVYRLVNQGTGNITLTPVVTVSNGTTSATLGTFNGFNFYEVISDGITWNRIG